MITLETPLAEVAQHLPMDAAKVLVETDPKVQELVLTQVRFALTMLEQQDISLDPIALDLVLCILVGSVVGVAQNSLQMEKHVTALVNVVTGLQQQLEECRQSKRGRFRRG